MEEVKAIMFYKTYISFAIVWFEASFRSKRRKFVGWVKVFK